MNLTTALDLLRRLKPDPIGAKKPYAGRRKHLVYYAYIERILAGLASDAKSLIDIGTRDAPYMEDLHWIPERICLDKTDVYRSPNVVSIEADFFTYEPGRKFDFATCFQVLEHIEDAAGFAQKLLTLSDRVLISVPYLWPEDATPFHVHDPVDLDKVRTWFGRDPDYSVIVEEPLYPDGKGRRVICYYDQSGSAVNLAATRTRMRAQFA